MAVTGIVLLVALRNGDLGNTSSLTAVLGFGLSVVGLAVNLWRDSPAGGEPARGNASQERLERLAERLAEAVEEQWRTEWRLRRLQDPYPLRVQWSPAEAWLADAPDGTAHPMDPDSQLDGLSAALDAIPSRRLVVLGGPGSGKTVLAVRFTLDRLACRASGDPVPVLFPLSGWQADRQPLRDWMAAHLATTHPGAPWTRELLRAGLVLPVLDGLDELPESSWGMALRRLNSELDPGEQVLVTCRTESYAKAVETGDVFTAAAVVELRPLSFEVASTYLVRTARPVRGAGGRRSTCWDPVVAELRADSDTLLAQTLRQAFGTPLMVAMARAVYGDTGKDPAELLDGRFADPAVLEQHLLEAFVPAAFADSPHADRARDWLGHLASHMQRQTTRRLAWWQLRLELPWPLRRLGPILLLGCAAVVISTVWTPTLGALAPLVTGAFVGGVCFGYLVLSHGRARTVGSRDRRGVLRATVFVAVSAVPVGAAVGCTSSTSLTWGTFLPYADGSAGWFGPVALAVAVGLATATALAVLGVVGEPLPSHTPFSRRRHVTFVVIVLLAAAVAFVLPLFFFAPVWVGAVSAVLIGCLVAIGLRINPGGTARIAPPGAVGRTVRGGVRRPLVRGLSTGLLIGLSLGAAFGIADATALSIRATVREEFPHGTVHRLADGTRYVITPDRWLHGLRPNGDRYLRTPGPVDGVVEEDADGTRYASTAASPEGAAHWDCSYAVRCTPFHGRIELRLRAPLDNPEVRLPNGTYVEDSDFQNEPPGRSAEWLYAAPPGTLFGGTLALALTVGLTLGLVSGLASGFHTWLVFPADTARAVSPQSGLATDRATVITRGVTLIAFGIGAAILTSGLLVDAMEQWQYVGVSLLAWVLVGPFAVVISAWGWFLVTRLWLCGSGRLPWRLMAFLDEAHRRGVLRQAGAAYEFRHSRLQEQLASTPRQQPTQL
ncbi:NACHT domain-containing protein [Streptomyces fractus]|uniref:NACHT domain-containing protein n=1 Tax=Streptomyces fractus TaxID=641806 RepID=UPI003CEFB472